jgi:hypothetical protein
MRSALLLDPTMFELRYVEMLAGPVDGHGRQRRFKWELGPQGADAQVAGFDVAVLRTTEKSRRCSAFSTAYPQPERCPNAKQRPEALDH